MLAIMNGEPFHFLACAAVAVLTIAALRLIPKNFYGWDKFIAIIVGMVVAAAKELLFDKVLGLGTPEFYDFLAGVYGAFTGMFIWVIVETIIQERRNK